MSGFIHNGKFLKAKISIDSYIYKTKLTYFKINTLYWKCQLIIWYSLSNWTDIAFCCLMPTWINNWKLMCLQKSCTIW